MQRSKNQHFAQRPRPVFSIHAPLVSPLCVAIGAPLESLAHLMLADTTADAFCTVADITGISLRYLIVCDHCPSLATASR
jgi:hypothetical protein